MEATPSADLRRLLPSVDEAMQEESVAALVVRHGRPPVLRELRAFLQDARHLALEGKRADLEALLAALPARIEERLRRSASPSLVCVINATGVVVHTNLGRAPLSRDAVRRVAEVASSYSNLELDLDTGERGQREAHAEGRLRALLDTEAAAVVNNCAAALLLAVNTLAEGKEVLVSRSELVEIGGSFRIPDVVRKGGATLREVGTTNRTRLGDYRDALSPRTGLVLQVHQSNFRIVGFTEAPTLDELAVLARSQGIPFLVDQGSGLLGLEASVLPTESTVAAALRAGADLVCFSGDKLLGGPQAGLLVGRRELVDAARRNPLYRALRVDKMTLAALDAVLLEHECGRAATTVPVLAMLQMTAAAVKERALVLAADLDAARLGLVVDVVEGHSAVGGGAAPLREEPTWLLALTHPAIRPAALLARLRAADPPVVARVADDRVLLDLRTVRVEDDPVLGTALRRALSV